MNDPKNELISSIREVFGYIARFKGQIFILKIEDSLLEHQLFPMLMRDISQLNKIGIRIIIIPGTRKSIDEKLQTFGFSSEFHNGIRLTSRESLPIVELASMGVTETLMSHLTANGCHGIQGNWIQARSLGIVDGTDYMATGVVEKIQKDIILRLLNDSFIPIIPPIGWNKMGHPYNINSTELAKSLCEHLSIGKLFFIGIEEGISSSGLQVGPLTSMLEVNEWGIISALDINQAKEILSLNASTLNHAQKEYLSNAVMACEAGADRVHLVSGFSQGAILHEVFSSRGDGTMVYANQYSSVRKATSNDVPDILRIMADHVKKGFLVSRSSEDILAKLDDYVLYEVDNSVLGCGALHDWGENFGEVAAIAVDPAYRKSGIGEVIVHSLLQRAPQRGFKKVFLLTTQALDWFYGLGFADGHIPDLPSAKQKAYDYKRNSRILIKDLSWSTMPKKLAKVLI